MMTASAAAHLCAMKIYERGRGLADAVATVDGASLDPRFDTLGDPVRALALSEAFMRAVVTELDNAWRLTGVEIDAALQRL